ncbi:hypothetical protein [Megamonas funiformis]
MSKEQESYSKIEHLKMIEEVIKRMANNSLDIKKLYVTLFVAFMVLILKEKVTMTNNDYRLTIFIMLIITVVFGFLDMYYLTLERNYRDLFDNINLGLNEENYIMKISKISMTAIVINCYNCKSNLLFYFIFIFILLYCLLSFIVFYVISALMLIYYFFYPFISLPRS